MLKYILLLLFVFGCTENELVYIPDDGDGLSDDRIPDISVDPESIDFGALSVLDGGEISQVVTILNEGEGDLKLGELTLSNTATYSVSSPSAVLLPHGANAQVVVTFTPLTMNTYDSVLSIESNDPDESVVEVPINGEGTAPVIDVTPQEYDFGNLYVGCDASHPLTITNVGNEDLIIDDIDVVEDHWAYELREEQNGPLPWTLPMNEELEIGVFFIPLEDMPLQSQAYIDSNDPLNPREGVLHKGTGLYYDETMDVYEQPLQSYSDVLFVVDNSCSMADEQASLANNFSNFMQIFMKNDTDWRIAVITTDSGIFRGDVITKKTPNAADVFAQQVQAGTNGSGIEAGLAMAYRATDPSIGGQAAPGGSFMREDGNFVIIFVSDEPDQSGAQPIDYYNYFSSLKADPDDFIAHAIAGDMPSGCGGATAGRGYYELTGYTGGTFLSICATDWGTHLETLAENSVTVLDQFDLTDYPVEETIEVSIDGVVTSTGWTYNATDNSVVFDEKSIPEGGSTIEIEYVIIGDCEE